MYADGPTYADGPFFLLLIMYIFNDIYFKFKI